MADRTKATPAHPTGATASTAGVLRPDELARHVTLTRRPAGARASRWVENHWSLQWDLPGGMTYASQTLPHPTCSLTLEVGDHARAGMPPGETLVVTGVVTRRFDVDVRGTGRVAGIRFRPGGLAALTGGQPREWADAVLPARDILPAHFCRLLDDPDLADDAQHWAALADDAVAGLDPGPDQRYDLMLEVVSAMLSDPTMLTVAEVADGFATSVRTLQRLFVDLIGVGPKWVLARYRMHDAVAELDGGWDGTLTDLAVRFGWYDQAHFTRDFTALVGVSPGQYRARG